MNDSSAPRATPGHCPPLPADATAAVLGKLSSAGEVDLGQLPPLAREVQRWQTAEGTQVRFVATHSRPMVDLVLRFRAGSALDAATPGLAALALYCLDQGTTQLDAVQFADQLEGLGAIMSRSVSLDQAVISLRSLSLPALRSSAMQLITQMVAHPALREADLEKIRQRLLSHLLSRTWNSQTRLSDTAMAQLFAGHPYATPYAGTAESLANISAEQLQAFHRKAYSANNLDIGLVGDLSREEAETLVDSLTQALPQDWAALPAPAAPGAVARTIHLDQPGSTTLVTLTLALQVSPSDPDYPALVMSEQILGAGVESRLMQELRMRRALTYNISSSLVPLDACTLLQIEWDIAPEYRDASQALVTSMLECFCEQGPSQAECELALNQVAGKLLRAMADNAQLAKGLAAFSHQGQPTDHPASHVQALALLTPEAIRDTARTWLDALQAVVVTLGPSVAQLPLPEATSIDQ
ncbi:M16 family metallopeptidase [Pseudomonas putida]